MKIISAWLLGVVVVMVACGAYGLAAPVALANDSSAKERDTALLGLLLQVVHETRTDRHQQEIAARKTVAAPSLLLGSIDRQRVLAGPPDCERRIVNRPHVNRRLRHLGAPFSPRLM